MFCLDILSVINKQILNNLFLEIEFDVKTNLSDINF